MGNLLIFNVVNTKKLRFFASLLIIMMLFTSCQKQNTKENSVVFVEDASVFEWVSTVDRSSRRCCLVFLYTGDLPDLHIIQLNGTGTENLTVEKEFVLPSDEKGEYNSYKIGYYYVDVGFTKNNANYIINSASISINGENSVIFTPHNPFEIKSIPGSSGYIQIVSPFPMGVAVGQKAVFGFVAQSDIYIDSFSLGSFIFLKDMKVSSDSQGKNILEGGYPYLITAGEKVYFSGIISGNDLCEYASVYCSIVLNYHTEKSNGSFTFPIISNQLGATIDEKQALPLIVDKIR